MAYSGTIGSTSFTTRKVIDHAFRRCKVPVAEITGEDIDIAKDQLFLMLHAWSAMDVHLWCQQTDILPIYEGRAQITLPTGTIDVLNANLRLLQQPEGAETDAASSYQIQFDEDTIITSIGVLWNGTSTPVNLQRSPDGAAWATIQSESPIEGSGEWSWFDLTELTASAYYRVVTVAGALNSNTVFFGNNPSEIPLSRMNRDEYFYLPNKSFRSERPLQFWLDRQADACVMNVWPVPSEGDGRYQLVVKNHRSIMDVGTLSQQIEVPNRWYEAVVTGLASRLGREIDKVDPKLISLLDSDASKAFLPVSVENRDKSPVNFNPGIAGYTR